MKIIALTDLHAKKGVLPLFEESLRSADLVLLCGDITHFGRDKEMEEIVGLIRQMNTNIYAVSGNCDRPEAEKYLVSEGLSLNAAVRKFNGYNLTGLSGSLPCPGRTPNEYAEEEYEAVLENLHSPKNEPLILVTHQPPFNTKNDEVSANCHVGSKSIRNFIEKQKPMICFTGHIHEGIAVDHIGPTVTVNPGPAGAGNYAVAITEGSLLKSIELHNVFKEKQEL
jgi:uncharacterized protein